MTDLSKDVAIRQEGRAGRITLNRPAALNALTADMTHAIDAALIDWDRSDGPELLIIDGAGDRAFCAGGDLTEIYAHGIAGDTARARRFWTDEYRMNARLFRFPRPVVTLLQGYTFGGGVGVGCHGSHRIVGDTSRVALPECHVGLVPDVGGSLLLALAPGRIGEFLGLTGDRMDAGDAIFAGFADYYLPEADWPGLIETLCQTGDPGAIDAVARSAPEARLHRAQAEIDAVFGGEKLGDIHRAVPTQPSDIIAHGLDLMARNSPLAMACALEIIRRVRLRPDIDHALNQEARFTFRSIEHADFLEGIRARIIDRDNRPAWRHADWQALRGADILRMTLPLGADAPDLAASRPTDEGT